MAAAKSFYLFAMMTVILVAVMPLLGQEEPEPILSRSWRVPPAMISMETPPPAMDARRVLEAAGVTFPPGASAIIYSTLDIVTVRNTAANLELAGAYIASIWPESPPQLFLTAHLVQAPEEGLRALAALPQRAQGSQLQKLMNEGGSQVEILHTLYGEATNGQRCKVESAALDEHTARLTLGGGGTASVETEGRSLGFGVEFDLLVRPGENDVRLTCAVESTSRKEDRRAETLTDPASGGPIETPVPDLHQQRATISATIPAGQSRLVAIWPVEGEAEPTERKLAQAVIMTPHMIRAPATDPASYALPDVGKDFLAMVEQSFDLPEELFDPNASTAPEDLAKFLPNNGIALPEKSEVRLDQRRRLVVKTNADVMPVVAAWVDRFWQRMTGSINVTVEVMEAPSARIRSFLQERSSSKDQAGAIAKLEKDISSGTGRRVALTHVETRSGHDTHAKAAWERGVLSGLEWHRKPQPAFRTEQRPVGLILDMSSVISVGYAHLHMNAKLQYDYAPPTPRREQLAEPVGKRTFLVPREEFHRAVADVSMLLPDGAPRVLAAWRPVGAGGKLGEDVMQVAVVTGRIVKWPKAERTDGKEPPLKRAAKPANAGEMTIRSFKIAPTFSLPESSASPFSSAATPRASDGLSAKQVLEAQGIAFPEGSSAMFVPATSNLLVRNTEANLALVEAYVKRTNLISPPDIDLTWNVIEAPASLVKKILAEKVNLPDHTAALQQLLTMKGTKGVRSVTLLKATDQAGQRAEVAQVQEQRMVQEVWITKEGNTNVEHETQRIGSALEFDTAVCYRNTFIEVACKFRHHLAPPVLRSVNLAPPDDPPVEIPFADYFIQDCDCVVALRSGTARIGAIWKPATGREIDGEEVLHIAFLQAATPGAGQE
jgi:hypothetical protein